MKKRLIAGLLAVLMVFSLAACGSSEAPAEAESTTHTITDLLGREVTIPNDVQRIAAIAGPTYEMVFMLGSGDQIVMVKSGHTDSYPLANLTNPKLIEMDGIAANPSSTVNIEDYLAKDIDLSMDMGFNGARAHEKVFEERWLYHADKKGYLVWGEYPNWGLDHTCPEALYSILPEWMEELKRDRNHPCIIGWCPFNETWDKQKRPQYDDLLRQIYRVTKAIDPSRPCIDTSGNFHVETDIYDVHDYEQDPVPFKEHYDLLMTEGKVYEVFDMPQLHKHRYEGRQAYPGKIPVFVSEYGGIRWAPQERLDTNRCGSWGYGKDPVDYEDFKARYKGLCDALLDNDQMFGLCYTQLTDVEQEQNGLYTYHREPKFDKEWAYSVMARKAAIED